MKKIPEDKLPLPIEPLPTLIDSHLHLGLENFADDRQQVIERARAVGVQRMIVIGAGAGIAGNPAALQLAEENNDIFATVGIHPHDAKLWSEDVAAKIQSWIEEQKAVAVGETGLDYHYLNSSAEAQKHAFGAQLRLAESLELPFIVHTREAHEDTLAILKEHRTHIERVGGVIHCFSEGASEVEAYLEVGMHISFSGIVTFPKAEAVREALKRTPTARLLLETDAPFLCPAPRRGLRNEPAAMVWTAEKVAEVLGQTLHEIALTTTQNTLRLFRLPEAT